MVRIDVNADVGEHDTVSDADLPVLDAVSSASVACGAHAGSPAVMRHTVDAAHRRGVAVGAHPAFPDRDGFGRRATALEPAAITAAVTDQIAVLAAAAADIGAPVRYVKPHGALYHQMADDESVAAAVCAAVAAHPGLWLVAPAGSAALAVAARCGVAAVAEAFADRAYRSDGRLVDRGQPGAVLTDPAEVAARAVRLAVDGVVAAVDGTPLTLDAGTICVHGDTPGAAALARAVRRALEAAGVTVAPFAP